MYFTGLGMGHSLKHAHTLAVGLDGFWACFRFCCFWREDYRFLQCCVFLDVTSQCLSIRAGNIESLPKSVTTNGSSDLAGVGVWTDAERETHGHTLYTSTANQARKKMITKVSKTYTECIFMHINWHIHTFHKDIAVFLILISSCCVCIWM